METGINYPFSDGMRFCSHHTKESDVIDVCECRECYADPFHNARPCWLSPLRQIALIAAARELNKKQVS